MHRLAADGGGPKARSCKEAPIRTLSVSILAVTAVAASLLVARSLEDRQPDLPLNPAGEDIPAEGTLEALRAAGL